MPWKLCFWKFSKLKLTSRLEKFLFLFFWRQIHAHVPLCAKSALPVFLDFLFQASSIRPNYSFSKFFYVKIKEKKIIRLVLWFDCRWCCAIFRNWFFFFFGNDFCQRRDFRFSDVRLVFSILALPEGTMISNALFYFLGNQKSKIWHLKVENLPFPKKSQGLRKSKICHF